LVRDPRRLRLHRAGISAEEAQAFGLSRHVGREQERA
jgi:hypothetical protein